VIRKTSSIKERIKWTKNYCTLDQVILNSPPERSPFTINPPTLLHIFHCVITYSALRTDNNLLL
jgi:hypothetical protein